MAKAFGEDFAHLLIEGESPFKSDGIKIPSLPSLQKVRSTIGLAPKYVACESFGRYPFIAGLVGNKIGLPPEWTDSGSKKTPAP
jgi:hypothetical protein